MHDCTKMVGQRHMPASPKALENDRKAVSRKTKSITVLKNKKELYGFPEDGKQMWIKRWRNHDPQK